MIDNLPIELILDIFKICDAKSIVSLAIVNKYVYTIFKEHKNYIASFILKSCNYIAPYNKSYYLLMRLMYIDPTLTQTYMLNLKLAVYKKDNDLIYMFLMSKYNTTYRFHDKPIFLHKISVWHLVHTIWNIREPTHENTNVIKNVITHFPFVIRYIKRNYRFVKHPILLKLTHSHASQAS